MSLRKTLEPSTVVVATNGLVSTELQGKFVILDTRSEAYLGLEDVSARIWKLIAQPRPIQDICEILHSEYDVDFERCEREVIGFVEQLLARGLIETTNAP